MKTFLLASMLCFAQLAFGQLDLDVTIDPSIGCPPDLEFEVQYGPNAGPSALFFSGCIPISSLIAAMPGVYTIPVCPACAPSDYVWSVKVTDCSLTSNQTTVGDPIQGYVTSGTMPGPVSCAISANNINFIVGGGGTNARVDITP